MSTLFNVSNAPRDLTALSSMSQAILYRLAMQLNLFKDDEGAEKTFMSSPSSDKAPVILAKLLELDNNPHAAAAQMSMPMTLPSDQQQPYNHAPQAPVQPGAHEYMSQPNFPGAPPGAAAPPGYAPPQQQLPYGAPTPPGQGPQSWAPPPGSAAPPQGWGPPPGAQAPPQPQYQQPPQYQPPMQPPAPSWAPPGAPPPQQQPQGNYAPPLPPGAPQAYQQPPQQQPPQAPQGGGWAPQAPPGVPPGAPQGGWAPPGGAPPGGAQGGYAPPTGAPPAQPPRQPSTASDPNNQGAAAEQLLQAIRSLTEQLTRQNELLAGLSTLGESSFILNVTMAQRMGITYEEISHRLSAERETIKAQFLSRGKA